MRVAVAVVLLVAAVAPAVAGERAIQVGGFFAVHDRETIPVWPERLQMLVAGTAEGPLIADAKRRAATAGNPARFIFYQSFSSLDGGCGCFDAELLARLRREHPEFVLKAGDGTPVSTYVDSLGPGRQLALDVGNPGYADAWADAALARAKRDGWDGVFADNVVRGRFDQSWSAVPVSPRTHRPYTVAEYRADTLAALRRVRDRFDAAGKLFVGNHGGGWAAFDEDETIRQQVLAMTGVEIEDFANTYGGKPQSEDDWLRQLRYLEFANAHGVLTWANGGGGTLMKPAQREFVLASYLLTRRGRSVVGDLNGAKTWWPAVAIDLGDAKGSFYCVEPATPCPAPGRAIGRDFTRARVFVNPGDAPRTVPLGGEKLVGLDDAAPAPDPLPLPPHSGRVLLRGDHTASRTSSGRAGR